jgi:hypothetical protein
MKINFPREIREETIQKLATPLKRANDLYRSHRDVSFSEASLYETNFTFLEELVGNSLSKLDSEWGLSDGTVKNVLPKLFIQAMPSERRYLLSLFKRLASR